MNCFNFKKINLSKILPLLMVIILLSCEKIFMEPDASRDPETVFEDIWTFADRHYSFFEYKDVDWDEVYSRYRGKVHSGLNPVQFFDICADMLYELKDGHVNLLSSFDRSRYWEWYLDSPENFYYSIIERHYYQDRQRYIGPLEYLDLGQLIYVYYGSFANTISEGNLDLLINNLSLKKGLILDIRNNGGGNIDNARRLASRFTEQKVKVGTNWVKSGPGHEDFITEDIFIEPHDGPRFDGKVVVLTNRRSYSASTYFTQYIRELSNVTLVGDTTGGGGGLPAFRDLPNGWLLRVSSSRFYAPDGLNIEGGIPPDFQIDIDEEEAFANEEDPIIEKAIELIMESK